ncbi:hypothetical protein HDU96_006726 [Phlyctochytrium bullatum]|nr:hypothetical protein HDU96_006726 [Phlyctochytrium bullatum]
MIDHIIGRPSAGWKRSMVLLIAFAICFRDLKRYQVIRRNGYEPPIAALRKWNRWLSRTPPWKIVLGTLTTSYVANNLFLLLFLNAPEPLARMYTRNFYRATWVLTALDAGFLTAMHIRPIFLRDFLSFVFFFVYLFYADAADEKVRKFRAVATIDIIRCSWHKSLNPYLRLMTFPSRGFLRIRHDIKIPRPTNPPSPSHFTDGSVPLRDIPARLFFAGSREELRHATCVLLDLPGGGFVAMPPKCHEDYLSVWARQMRVPIVSIDYGKAPEFPYPYALEECFDAYRAIVESNGAVLGLEGWYVTDKSGRMQARKDPIKVVLIGDSAGGNFVAGVTMKCLEATFTRVPPPAGIVLAYPCLDFDMGCWMPQEKMRLFRAESKKDMSMTNLMELHGSTHTKSPLAVPPAPRKIDVLKNEVDRRESWYRLFSTHTDDPGPAIPTSLSMTSRMSYFTDRVIAPEMLRGMALLYLGSSPKNVNFLKDYYLSPILAPDDILARFPRTFLICGEKDPLVDDMVIFAGRLRQAKTKARREWERLRERRDSFLHQPRDGEEDADGVTFAAKSGSKGRVHFGATGNTDDEDEDDARDLPACTDGDMDHHVFHRDPDEMVRVKILEGVSHALLQMTTVLPEAIQTVTLLSDWALELFEDAETAHQVGLTPGDEVQGLTDYLSRGLSDKPQPKANGTGFASLFSRAMSPAIPIPNGKNGKEHRANSGVVSGSPPKSVLGALAATTSEELLERSAIKVSTAGATVVGSRTSSPRMQRSKLNVKSQPEKVTEKNFLERRNRAMADTYEI